VDKLQLRKEMKEILSQQSRGEIEIKSKIILEKLETLEQFKKAKTIGIYLSKPKEVQTFDIIKKYLKEKEFSVPITNSCITFAKLTSLENLIKGKYDILEPKEKEFITYIPEIIILPAVSFDLNKNRLGYGKGCYDIFLKSKKTFKLGIVFDFQIVDNIKTEPHDVKMDLIITEKRKI